MHVGFALLTLFPGRVGGTESNVLGLLGEFSAGNGPERITVLANRRVMASYGAYERGPVSLHHVTSYRPGDSIPTRALAMAFARTAPGLVARDVPPGLHLVHFPLTVPIPRTGLPEVVTLYDVQHLDLPQFFSPAERLFRRWAYEGAARRATLVVTTSEYSRRRLCEHSAVDPERVEVVALGVDTGRFVPGPVDDDEALLADLDLPERFVVYPANMWPHKNHQRLVEALAAARERELALVLTGQPYGRLEPLLERARRLGVDGRVRHLGYVSRDVMPALYRRAVAMVFPSLYEGFGTPPLEAMACGCPVATSKRGSLGEVCDDAILPFEPESVAEIAATIDRVASDDDARARLRDAGLRRVSHFTWSLAARRHLEVYERALAEA